MNSIRKYMKLLEGQEEGNFDYTDAGTDAPEEIKKVIEEFHSLPDSVKKNKPLLYYILGSGTPPYKMSRKDSEYTDQAKNPETTCANCEYAYQKVISEKYICSQIRDEIQPPGWCNQWVKGKK